MRVVFYVLLGWLFGVGQVKADTAFLALKNSRQFASAGNDLVSAMVRGENGATYVAGTFENTISGSADPIISAGSLDIFLTKLLPDGTTDWLVRCGGAGVDKAECLAFDATNGRIYIGGIFNGTASFGSTNLTAVAGSDAFVACFSTAGALQWVRQIGGAGQEDVTAMQVSSYGLHVSGTYTQTAAWGTTTFTPTISGETMFVILADANGAVSSGLYANSTQSVQPDSLAVLSNGTTVVGGRFAGTAFFTAQQLRTSTTGGGDDLFVVAYDANRAFQWAITGGGTGQDEVQSLAVSQQGGLLLGVNVEAGGQIAGQALDMTGTGVVVGRITEAGAWTKTFELAGPQMQAMVEGKRGVLHLAANTIANSVTLGTATVTPSGGQYTGFVASYLTNGVWGGVSTLTASSWCVLLDVAMTADDGVIIGGYSISGLKFNGQTLGNGNQGQDAFVVQLTPPEQKLVITKPTAQVLVTYPAYYYNATLWETPTLNPISWTQEGTAPTINTGEVQVNLSTSPSSRFYQLRFSNP